MEIDSLWYGMGPWRGPALALAAALAWAGLLRLLRRPDLAALGAAVGLAAGMVVTLGAVTASPRQLPERLPLLVLAGALGGLALALAGGRGRKGGLPAAFGVPLMVAGAAWWLAGMPVVAPDLQRTAVTLAGLAVLIAALLPVLAGPWHGAGAAGLLAAGLWLAAPLGPWLVLAAAAAAACLGGAVAGRDWSVAARLPVALGLGAVVAGPVLARGTAADWTAAAGPLVALWAAPVLAGRSQARWARFVAWIVAGGLPLLFTWLQVHRP
jgi:hypothetical protein